MAIFATWSTNTRKRTWCIVWHPKSDRMVIKLADVTEMDTTHIGFAANNKIYTVLPSEDKSKMLVFKINSKNKKSYMYDQPC